MIPHLTYFLCATPRSGSTLLCALLTSSGVAGQPELWFRTQNMAEWARDWGIARPDGSFDWGEYRDAVIRAGTGKNGVFGLRLMWDHLGGLSARLGSSSSRDLHRIFGPLRCLYLYRRDLVAQAISRHRAEVSGIWHLGIEEAENPVPPRYDFAGINAHLAEVQSDHVAWQGWFAANGMTPLTLAYEDLSRAPAATASAALDHLGLTPIAPLHAANRKMSDATSARWAARFRADQARQ